LDCKNILFFLFTKAITNLLKIKLASRIRLIQFHDTITNKYIVDSLPIMAPFGKKDKEEKVKLKKGALKRAFRVFRYIKPYRFTFFFGLFFLVLSSITTMGFPYLIGSFFGTTPAAGNESFSIDNMESSTVIVTLLFGVFVANAIFSFFRVYLFSIVTEKSLQDLRNAAFKQLIFSPISFYDKNKVGELSSRIATDINLLQELLMTTIAEFIRQWITVIISIVFIAYVSLKLSGIMLATVPLVAILAVIFGKKIKKLSKQAQDASADSNTILQETLMGIKNVKSFANEAFEIIRFNTATESIKDLSIRGAIFRGLFAAFIIIGMFGAVTIVIWQGVNMTNTGELEMHDFIRFILFTIFLGASFGGISSMFGTIQKAIGATERLMDLLDETNETQENEAEFNHTLKGNVVFKDINFHYETRPDINVINNLNFEVKEGQTTAIVGPSGAGKSTISSLLLRFYEPTNGSILFDNIPSSDFNRRELRNQMAIVPQEVILFGGSIEENIAYGNPEASFEEIENAAKQANAYNFITEFPESFKTTVGDRGIQLSGGQKQRIAIARAVLKNPKILILDEATSSLDSESEKLVQDALEKLMIGRTSFVIAHRLSTIKNADKILVVDKGAIVESGTHQELSNNKGIYAKLSSIQFEQN
jgi:ABC-type multidrug transport system fused ATPase/permease subunit